MNYEPSDRMLNRFDSSFEVDVATLLARIEFLHSPLDDIFKWTTLTSFCFFILPFLFKSGVHGCTTLIKCFNLGIAFRFRVVVGC